MKLKDNSLFITLDNTTATGSYKLTKKEGFKELNTAYWKYKDYMKAQLKKVATVQDAKKALLNLYALNSTEFIAAISLSDFQKNSKFN